MQNTCQYCQEPLSGRSDKKFCTPYCKSSFHYQKNKEQENSTYLKIDYQLKLNRRLLKKYNQSGKSIVRKQKLLAEGFNPNYFTNYWKNKRGEVYLFCYEFGFLECVENGKNKYVLVYWQRLCKKRALLFPTKDQISKF